MGQNISTKSIFKNELGKKKKYYLGFLFYT